MGRAADVNFSALWREVAGLGWSCKEEAEEIVYGDTVKPELIRVDQFIWGPL